MKKLLLSLCALFAVASMNAQYAAGDYIYTATAKYKVQSVLDVAQPGPDWNHYSSEIFSPYTAETEDDFDGIQSVRSDEGDYISLAVDLELNANYLVTMKFKATADGTTSITDGGLNQIDAWVAPNDQGGVRAGIVNLDYQQVASTATLKANEWVEISWAFADTLTANAQLEEGGGKLNLLFSRISSENVIAANLQVIKVTEVYDTRIADKQFEYAEKLLADPNFNTAAAADAKATVEDDIYGLKAMYDVNHEAYDPDAQERPFDNKEEAEDLMKAFFEDLALYLDVESSNLNEYLKYIDIVSFPSYGRGRITSAQGCFTTTGGNWGHLSGTDYLMSAIQTGYAHSATLTFGNTDFPAGKYFVTAELRNANTTKTSWPCEPVYTLTTEGCTITVGNDVTTLDPISGEQYQKFYAFGEVTEDGKFQVDIYWPGVSSGGAFMVRALEVRGFDKTIPEKIARKQAWDPFITQWNAAVEGRKNLIAIGEDNNYPWANDTIQGALDRWDPFYNGMIAKGWIGEDNSDTGVATNEELIDWTKIQDFPADIYGPEGSNPLEDYETYKEYALVRGYQYARNYIINQNKPIQDAQAKIAECWAEYGDARNSEADHETFEAIIKSAEQTVADIIASTNDEKQEADSQTLADLVTTLEEAKIAFQESGVLTPFVDIDFSGGFTPVYGDEEDPETVTAYVINGKSDTYDGKGTMQFATLANVQPDLTVDGQYWQLGFGDVLLDVLHVGSSEAYVEIPADQVGDDEILEIDFDAWYGNLSKGFFTVELRNADNVRLAGFSLDRYNSNVAFNTFNNATGEPNDLTAYDKNGGTGMNIRQYVTGQGSSSVGNAGVCIDDNKSSFTLIYDYKANAMKGKVINAKNGTCDGEYMPMLFINDNTITDNKVAKFVITSNYNSANSGAQSRRCWFDNLKMFKYKSVVDGPLFEPKSTPEDVNGDDAVNITDVVDVINCIASGQYDKKYDVDGNGSVNITDVVKIINKIAGIEQ